MRLRNPPASTRGDIVNDFALDEVVRELYYDDNLDAAWEHGLERGLSRTDVKFYRLLEAEYLTRKQATIVALNDKLSLEYDPHERGFDPHRIPGLIREECDGLTRRFQWPYEAPVRVTILIEAVDAPWHYHRAGYCIDKYPFEKICIPASALLDEPELRYLIRHEFMHAVTLNLCNGHEPVWLTEGVSVFVEGQGTTSYWRRFQAGQSEWRSPMYLNGGIKANRWGDSVDPIREGYEQASIVVSYLHHLGGDQKLITLMKDIGDESFGRNFKRTLLGQNRTDAALRDVYGLTEEKAFQRAFEWLKKLNG